MILQIDDWKFDIDIARTMAYSAAEAAEHCTCAYCRNFYAAVDDAYPALRPFLAQFGLNIEAPEEMIPIFFEDSTILYDPSYKVFGKILKQGAYEMNAGLVNIVARNSVEADCILLDCFELLLHWHLDESLDDVLSPANEPSMIDRAIEKLLANASKSDLIS